MLEIGALDVSVKPLPSRQEAGIKAGIDRDGHGSPATHKHGFRASGSSSGSHSSRKSCSTSNLAAGNNYWDAAEVLYEKLPVVGAAMRWLKRRVNA